MGYQSLKPPTRAVYSNLPSAFTLQILFNRSVNPLEIDTTAQVHALCDL